MGSLTKFVLPGLGGGSGGTTIIQSPSPTPAPAPAVPTTQDAELEASQKEDALRRRNGYTSTIMAGGLGGDSQPQTASKVLLGS